jgi:hypothetical protein
VTRVLYNALSGVVGTDQRISTPTVTNGVSKGEPNLFGDQGLGRGVSALSPQRGREHVMLSPLQVTGRPPAVS